MPLSVTCSFCGKQIESGTGLMYVRNDNQRFYFCSHKCERNQLNLRRRARRIKWTTSYEKGPSPPQLEKPKVEGETIEEEEVSEKPKAKKSKGKKSKGKKQEEPVEEEPVEEEPVEEEPVEEEPVEEDVKQEAS